MEMHYKIVSNGLAQNDIAIAVMQEFGHVTRDGCEDDRQFARTYMSSTRCQYRGSVIASHPVGA
jgi:hypothetical protein